MRIPTLAIHLDRSVKEGFSFNTELQLTPIIATATKDKHPDDSIQNHHGVLLDVLREEANVSVNEQIISTDLCLYDITKAALGGPYKEFILSARLDNLMLSFCTGEVNMKRFLYAFSFPSQLWKLVKGWIAKPTFKWLFGSIMRKSDQSLHMVQCLL